MSKRVIRIRVAPVKFLAGLHDHMDERLHREYRFDGTLNVMAHAAKERDVSKLLPVLKTLLLNSRPRTPVEAMLLTQMMTAQEMANRLALRALHTEDAEASASYSNRAERFMNLFTRQAECLQKLKGLSGQQKVVVEHLNVTEGGKAVVGQVIGKREDGHEGKS